METERTKKRKIKDNPQRTLQCEGTAVTINDIKAAEQTAANRDK